MNYIPSKFSSTLLSGGPKRRRHWKSVEIALPKRGGGEASRSDEARVPGGGDEYDGVNLDATAREGGHMKPRPLTTKLIVMEATEALGAGI